VDWFQVVTDRLQGWLICKGQWTTESIKGRNHLSNYQLSGRTSPHIVGFRCCLRSGLSEQHYKGPSMSVCLSPYSWKLCNVHDEGSLEHIVPTMGDGAIVTTHFSYTGSLRSLLEHVVPTVGAEVVVGAHCSNSWSRSHCWSTLFQQFEPRSSFEHIVPTVWAEVVIGAHCSDSWSRSHCWSTLFRHFEPRSLL
jgi:hypothetical protein